MISCPQISSWVEKSAGQIDPSLGPVLDLACGAGRHSKYLHSLGMYVISLDREEKLLKLLQNEEINCVSCDLEASTNQGHSYVWPFSRDAFSAIVVTNYLHRPLFSELLASIKPGGVLIYETFAIGNEAYGRPRNRDFLLQENELLQRCVFDSPLGSNFVCIAFEHGLVNQASPAIVQRICARRL